MKKVLCVENDEVMAEIIKLSLDETSYCVETATNGNEAMALYSVMNPDLVLMDLDMPGMNGFETTRKLREKGFRKPIVALTASDTEQDRSRAISAGCDDYIVKTVDMADVETTVSRYC